MAEGQNRGLLSLGIFFLVLMISIVMYVPVNLVDWPLIPPLISALYGCWMMILAGIRQSNPYKYERSPFSTLAWGLVLLAIGGAWVFWSVSWLYSVMIMLFVLGALALIAAFRRK